MYPSERFTLLQREKINREQVNIKSSDMVRDSLLKNKIEFESQRELKFKHYTDFHRKQLNSSFVSRETARRVLG